MGNSSSNVDYKDISGYKKVLGKDSPGDDITVEWGIPNESDCARRCSENPKCVAFGYDAPSRTRSGGLVKGGHCALKSYSLPEHRLNDWHGAFYIKDTTHTKPPLASRSSMNPSSKVRQQRRRPPPPPKTE